MSVQHSRARKPAGKRSARPRKVRQAHSRKTLESRIDRLSEGRRDALNGLIAEYEKLEADEQRDRRRIAQAKREIGEALAGLPIHRFEVLLADHYDVNAVASAPAVQNFVDQLVVRWHPDIKWRHMHAVMKRESDSDDGYCSFMNAFRDAAFLMGVAYMQQQIPDWFGMFRDLDDEFRQGVKQVVEAAHERQQEARTARTPPLSKK